MKKLLRLLLIINLFLVFSFIFQVQATNETNFGGGKYIVNTRVSEQELSFGVNHFSENGLTGLTSAVYEQVINIVDVPASKDLKIVPWSKLGSSRWNMATLTSMAKDFEQDNPGYRVIAGINGDFFDINGENNLPNATEGIHVAFGNVYKSTPAPTTARKPIGFKNDGSLKPIVGNVPYEKADKMTLTIYNAQDEIIETRQIDKVNSLPGEAEIALYYANWSAPRKISPLSAPLGYVVKNASFALAFSETDFYGLGTISAIEAKTLGEGEFSLVVNDDTLKQKLQLGLKIRVQYDLAGAFSGLENATGAGKAIIYDGVFQEDTTTFGTARHPRTMVGSKSDGSIVMCVVDGRQTGMEGVRQEEMAAIMHHYGCVDAYNLDGGGSSTMLILDDGEFKVTNTPSGGNQRSDSNCLLVVVSAPLIAHSFTEILPTSLRLDSQIINPNGFDLSDLFIKLNDEYYKIGSESIIFSNLTSNTVYSYAFYIYENEHYHKTPIEGKILTAKIKPELLAIKLERVGNDYFIYPKFSDPDKAIERKRVILGAKSMVLNSNSVTFENYLGELSSLVISFSYNVNDGRGRLDEDVRVIPIECSLLLFLTITQDNLKEALNSFLGS